MASPSTLAPSAKIAMSSFHTVMAGEAMGGESGASCSGNTKFQISLGEHRPPSNLKVNDLLLTSPLIGEDAQQIDFEGGD